MLNCSLIGNIGGDCELKYSASGSARRRYTRVDGSLAERLIAHSVESDGNGDPPQPTRCLLTTYVLNDGYGMVQVNGHTGRVHAEAYKLWVGLIPERYEVTHKCNVRHCFRPSHLLLGTTQQNADYKVACGRSTFGERHPKAKLTAQQVVAIREQWAAGESVRGLAREYAVSRWSVEHIVQRKNWKHIA